MRTEKDNIELLVARVEEMRMHQKDFFARKMQADKRLAITKEKEVDELCRQLRKRGYDPEKYKNNKPEQKSIF